MALIRADRVLEITTTTGVGPYTLAGTESGYQPFSAVCSGGDTIEYVATDDVNWEVALGTYNAGVLNRTSIYASSNGGLAVNWGAGNKTVFCDIPAHYFTTAPAGTVTSVSVTTANGVSGSVANPTSTPAITLTLGAITPSSVVASGNVTGAALIPTGSTVPTNGLYLNAANSVALASNGLIGLSVDSSQTTTAQGALQSVGDLKLIGKFTVLAASGDGNFVGNVTAANLSGTNTGDQTSVTGNAGTATALQNARTIGAVSFNGTANIVPQTIQTVDDAADTTCFPLFANSSGTQTGGQQPKTNSSLGFNASTGALSATSFSGAGTGLTGTAASLTSGNVTTNANLTGALTSVGNATSLGSFTSAQLLAALTDETGTGSAVFAGSPTLTGTVNGAAATWSGNDTAAAFIPTGTTVPTYGMYKFDATNLGFAAGSAAGMKIDGGGNLLTAGGITSLASIAATTTVSGTAFIPSGATVPTNGVYLAAANTVAIATNSANVAQWGAGTSGVVTMPGINNNTTLTAANVTVDTSGGLKKFSSSLRYKKDVEDLDFQYALNLLQLRPAWFRSTCKSDPENWSYYGFIAEEVAKIDKRLVTWDYLPSDWDVDDSGNRKLKDGATLVPDGVPYSILTVGLVALAQMQDKKISELETRLSQLEKGR